jgi:hypothetical protein
LKEMKSLWQSILPSTICFWKIRAIKELDEEIKNIYFKEIRWHKYSIQ